MIEDLCYFTEKKNIPGIILSIDFEKAFDTINWNFMFAALKKFNFGKYFIQWISILYNNIQAVVTNNGYASDCFTLQRGIRQGCPLSAYLFIIAVEILAQKIRCNNNIEGVEVCGKVLKISQLADDTTCFLKNLKSLDTALVLFQQFEKCAGLKLNIEKTKAKYLGSLKNDDYYPHGLSWIKNHEHINTLGVVCYCEPHESYELNFKPRLINMQNLLRVWKMRNLSLKGKITIINSLALAPLIYLSSVIDTPSRVYKEVRHLVVDFLWNGKPPKIAYKVLTQDISKGGLKLCDFEIKVNALLLTWVKRLVNENSARWKTLPCYFYHCDTLLEHFSSKFDTRFCQNNEIPTFYKTIHKCWLELYSTEPATQAQVLNEYLWHNKFITSAGKSLCFSEWKSSGIKCIKDLLNVNREFYTYEEVQAKYGVKCNFLEIMQVRHSIPWSWRQLLQEENINSKTETSTDCPALYINLSTKYRDINDIKCKDFYWAIINMKQVTPACVFKWQTIFVGFKDCDPDTWTRIFKMSFNVTRETKLQSFQYKLLNRIIPCNKWLHDVKIKTSNQCSYCDEVDDLVHFFVHCDKINYFWNTFFKWWSTTTGINVLNIENFEECILFGFPENDNIFQVLNYCILLAKYYIYCNRLFANNRLDMYQYQVILKQRLAIEKYICIKEGKQKHFDKYTFIYENM